ncbi:hypothetical protein ACHAXM_007362 [Skeletonema potamos]|jgi:hypothetical protein
MNTATKSETERIVMKTKPKTQSLAAVVVLTTFSATLAPGEVQHDDPTTTSSSLRRTHQSSVGEAATENKAVVKTKKSNHETIANRHIPRYLTSVANAPGCGPSSGTYHSVYLGCYDDRQEDRAFPFQVPSDGHGALDCERECTTRSYRYFGRQFKGQCFCGSDYGQIVRHGADSGCNCCGENVGGGKQCVWENMKHPESQAEAPVIAPGPPQPEVLPQPDTQEASAPIPNSQLFVDGAHVGSISLGSTNNIFDEPATEPEQQSVAQAQPAQQSVAQVQNTTPSGPTTTTKPTKAFRLRLYWQPGYNWQGSKSEKWWCAECTGNCSSGSRLQIGKCSQTNRQMWIAIDNTIRFAPTPSLCVTASGYGSNNPIRLHQCNGGRDQNFDGVQEQGRFELQPASNTARCVSQQHHPKGKEPLYLESCSKTRATDTTYWQLY